MDPKYQTLSEAAKTAPGRPHTASLWRWARRGVLGRNGERIRLEHVRVGGRILIQPGALDEFFRAVADADKEYFDCDKPPSPKRPKSTERKRSIERAQQTLREAGILKA